MILEKSILQTDFKGEKFAGIYLVKIISCPENIAHDVYSAEKKSYAVICQGKNF